ncbi:MAG: 3-dehydro-scyllo-inosose hydrolase [Promethearchaeota archaeon]
MSEKWKLPPEGGMLDAPGEVYLQNMTMKQVLEKVKRNDIVILPTGSTESHGGACPLWVDTLIVTRMAEQLAKRTGVTVAMPTPIGSHPYHHLGMPGTIVLPEEVFKAQIRAYLAGLWNMGLRKIIIFNTHGQEYVIPSAIHEFMKNYQVPAVIVHVSWYHIVPDLLKDKEHGGPFETPFIHADEVETSVSLNLFPELVHMELAEDNQPRGYLPEGHVDKAGNAYNRPIKWYSQAGLGPIEVSAYPQGSVGAPTKASADNAKPAVVAIMDYMEKLIEDIKERFPPGVLPPVEEITQRDPALLEPYLKFPLSPGWKSIYELRYPP